MTVVDLAPRIVVVEDDAIIGNDIAETLSDLGYDVVQLAPDADAAIAAVDREDPDLVLLDIHLGGARDGIDAGVEISQRFGTPILYLTAFSDTRTLTRAQESAPYGYLVKPFQAAELRATVEVALHRSQLEKLLRESEERFRATLQSMTESVLVVDLSGISTYVNPAGELLLGRPSVRVLGNRAADVFQIVDSQGRAIPDPFEEVLRLGRPIFLTGRVALRTGNGRSTPVGGSVAPIGSTGELHGAVMIAWDASLEHELQRIASERERHLRALFEGDLWSSFVLDPACAVMEANPAFAELMGVAGPDDVLGADFRTLVPDVRDLVAAAKRGEELAPLERRVIRADGSTRRVIVSLEASAERLVGRMADVTLARSMQDDVERARKLESVGRFASGFAQEFNNLLTIIQARAELASDALGSDSDVADDLAEIRTAARRAADLVVRLLTIGQRRLMHRRNVDTRELLEAFAQRARTRLRGEVGLTLVHERSTTIQVDLDLFGDVLGAVVENAEAALEGRGTVTIRTRVHRVEAGAPEGGSRHGDFVAIIVEDDGPGMPPEVSERAAEPFFTTREGHLGLGLAFAHGFAAQEGGWLHVDSAPGRGTAVTIHLPVPLLH